MTVAVSSTIFALRVALEELQQKTKLEKEKEEQVLRQLFIDAGGSASLIHKNVNLSERAMKQMLENTQGIKNLQRLRANSNK